MAGVQLFERADASAPPVPAPASAPVAAPVGAAPAAAMAAQASAAAPAGQPLRAVASAAEPVIEPPVAPSIPTPAIDEPAVASVQLPPPQAAEQQRSLDWTAPPASAETQQQVCNSCGTTIAAGQKFCLSCGTPVGQAASPVATEAPAFSPAEQIQPLAATQIFEPVPKSSSKAWIIVVIAVAALGAGGYFGWQYFTRPDVTVTTNVQRIHVAAGGKTSLEANVSGSSNTDVDWSVQEGSKGGQVTASGTVMSGGQLRSGALYTAPQTTGTYHVIATSRVNSSRSAKIEIIVGGTALPDNTTSSTQPAPPSAPTATTSTSPSATASPAAAYPNAGLVVGTWTGPTTDTRTTIGADSTISMSSTTNAQNNKTGTYHFTDNTHLDVDLGNGDVRKWEILGIQGAYLRVSEQAKSGSSALIFQKVQ